MENVIQKTDFEAKKASANDWEDVLKLLKETNLDLFKGNENYKDFYLVFDKNGEPISCFAITKNNEIGILKSFAVSKNIQRKGTGKFIANIIIPEVAKNLGVKILYLLGCKKDQFTSYYFWQKTNYKQLEDNKTAEKYFEDYLESVKNKSPEYYFREAAFYMDLI